MAKHKLDMSNVEEFTQCDEGIHLAKIVSMESKTADTGTEMEVGCFEIIKGPCTGARVYENFPLTQKALFKVKKLLKALDLPHEGKNVIFDTGKIVDKIVAIEVSHYEYDGKERCRIDEFLPAAAAKGGKGKKADDDDDDDDYEEEKPAKKSKKKPVDEDEDDDDEDEAPKKAPKKKKPEPEPEEDDDDDDDDDVDYNDMSAKELFALCKERGIDVKPKLEPKVYIKKLEKWDAEHKKDDDEDEWADDDE